MPEEDSVSRWLDGLKAGDDEAIQRLWDHYFQRLARLAGKKLAGRAHRGFDEEDVALSAFNSFCARVGKGQFPQLSDQNDLWRLLAVITARKADYYVRHQARRKRGGGRVLGESAITRGDDGDGLAQFLSTEPTAEFVAQVSEEYARLLECLGDDQLRSIAIMKMEGHTAAEIAGTVGTTLRTVERRIGMIRKIWTDAAVRDAD